MAGFAVSINGGIWVSTEALVFQRADRNVHQSIRFLERSLIDASARVGTGVLATLQGRLQQRK
jgi:hypothetical protein